MERLYKVAFLKLKISRGVASHWRFLLVQTL